MRIEKTNGYHSTMPCTSRGSARATVPPTHARGQRPSRPTLTPAQVQLLQRVLMPLMVVTVFLGGWEFTVHHMDIPRSLLPAPSYVYERMRTAFSPLMTNAWPTTLETMLSFLIATVGGVVLALALTSSTLMNASFYPIVVFFQLIPKIALAPLFVVWMGIGSTTRIEFAAFMAFFPVVISTMAGLRATPGDALRLCQGLTATPWQVFFLVRLPYAVPYIFSGMKIAITLAMIGVIVAEFISAERGLGYLIVFASSQADTALILAAILILCAIGLVLYGLVALGEWLAMRRYC
ncbi:ABC transporter permease [Alloalcanivorax profundimaris]|nr:ABC transporter permease [Alloalcanivorax profundimaris]